MLLELPDACKQRVWGFLPVQALCRAACVARKAEDGLCMDLIWRQHVRTLLSKGLTCLQTEWRVLGCGLQREFASRILLERGRQMHKVTATLDDDNRDERVGSYDTMEWKRWYRDTHVVSTREGQRDGRDK